MFYLENSSLTYKQLLESIEAFSKNLISFGLSSGRLICSSEESSLTKLLGGCVAIVLPNGIEFLISFLAVGNVGCKCAPLNPAYLEEEFSFYLKDTESKVLLSAFSGVN